MAWNDVVDTAVELPVITSFTRLGHDIRSRVDGWEPVGADMSDRTVVLTGPTSGIGRAAAEQLAGLGATLFLVGRDRGRTEATRRELVAATGNDDLHVALADLGDLDAVRSLADELAGYTERIDVLIHNAGALSAERERSPQGIEATVASQVLGPFLLTARLLPQLRRNDGGPPGRVITMSSGGMYAANLTVDQLQMDRGDYRGSEQYARAKRAQVTLNQMWAERVDPDDVVFHSMHPGWSDTPGVEASLPTFRRIMGPLLRSPEQAADTLVWLAAEPPASRSSGEFWLDRRTRPIHKLPMTRRSDTPDRRRRLWESCVSLCDLADSDVPPAR